MEDGRESTSGSMAFNTFCIHAKNADSGAVVRDFVQRQGFEYSDSHPDFVLSVGGDGTYLQAERRFPGIPKLLVRDSLICAKCEDESLDTMLEQMRSGGTRTRDIIKIEAIAHDRRLLAVNDIILRNEHPTQAIRFKLAIDGKDADHNVIGDGIVAATPFGATGYYRSVTRRTFDRGIGVAFNNPTEPKEPLILGDESKLSVELTRGNAQLAFDNDPSVATVAQGDRVTIRKAAEVARLIVRA
jgi:NAD+ kinase